MFWIAAGIIGVAVVALAAGALCALLVWIDGRGRSTTRKVLTVAAGALVAIAGFCTVVWWLCEADYQYHQDECANYAAATDRAVRYERTGLSNFDCYVQTNEGWVTRDDIVKVDD